MRCRENLDGKAIGLMVFLCVILGMQQVAIKAAAVDMPPVLQMIGRSGLAAFLVGLYLCAKGLGVLPAKGKVVAGLVAGVLFALEYFFMGEGLRLTSASHMVTTVYTAPAFAAIGLHLLLPEERLKRMQWCGMGLSFLGIIVAFFDFSCSSPEQSSVLMGDVMGLCAGISWGATTVVIRIKLSETPPAQTLFVQLITCCCLLLPWAAFAGELNFSMTTIVWGSLFFQVFIVCVLGMMLWFWLLTVYPASQLGVLCFLTPLFGVVFGVVLLEEPVSARFIIGTLLVILGIIIVSSWRRIEGRFIAKSVEVDAGGIGNGKR